jgi:hypothetical protein
MLAYLPGLDPERLVRHEAFLFDRAASHDKKVYEGEDAGNVDLHRSCAATLLRDAAAIAALRGDGQKAKKSFAEAGARFASLGLFVGFPLLEFSRAGAAEEWISGREDLAIRIDRAMSHEDEAAPREKTSEPFLYASAASPRQMLYLYEALFDIREPDETGGHLRNRLRSTLLSLPGFPVGPTGTPLAQYFGLLDQVAELGQDVETYLASRARDTFLSIILRRREQLEAAQSDSWHWKMILNPADLIDLDLVMLGLMVIERTGSTLPLDDVVEDRGELAALPLRMASLLRSESPRSEPSFQLQ